MIDFNVVRKLLSDKNIEVYSVAFVDNLKTLDNLMEMYSVRKN